MGYGYKLGIDLPGEKRGFIPNSKFYDKVYRGRWNSSTVISIAIGQGEILATPLQICNLAATVANRGYYGHSACRERDPRHSAGYVI